MLSPLFHGLYDLHVMKRVMILKYFIAHIYIFSITIIFLGHQRETYQQVFSTPRLAEALRLPYKGR